MRTSILLLLLGFAGSLSAAFAPRTVLSFAQFSSLGDFDNDGDVDIFLSREIWRNDGHGQFTAIGIVQGAPTQELDGKAGPLGGSMLAWVDMDNDGTRDVLVFGPNWSQKSNAFVPMTDRIYRVVWENEKIQFPTSYDIKGYSSDLGDYSADSKETFDINRGSTNAVTFLDYDRDGKVDIYLGRGRTGNSSDDERYGKSWLVRNTLDPKNWTAMVDVTNTVGMGTAAQLDKETFRPATAAAAVDFDWDGWPDIFVANYRGRDNFLWHGGEKTFQNGITGVSLKNQTPDATYHGTGMSWFDLDSDGNLDLLISRLVHNEGTGQTALQLFRNLGGGRFEDISSVLPGDAEGGHDSGHYWSAATGDYDNDGDVDVYLARSTQLSKKISKQKAFGSKSRGFGRLLRNQWVESGKVAFEDVTEAEGLHNPSHMDVMGAAFLDVDGDGWLELYTSQGFSTEDAKNEIWENSKRGENKYLEVSCDQVGVVVQVWWDGNDNGKWDVDEKIQTRQVNAETNGLLFDGPRPMHFGLGENTERWKSRVRWPGHNDAKAQCRFWKPAR